MPTRIHYNTGELVGDAYFLHDADNCVKRRMAAFRCKCGNKFFAEISKVKSYVTRSCGCLHKENTSKSNSTHRLTGHKLYRVWKSMRNRCYNKNVSQYKDYGGKGVSVCEEWKNDFINFYTWCIDNGWREGLQLDKDISGNGMIYSPECCSFVTPKQNSNKRRTSRYILHNGEKRTVSGWADYYKISLKNLYQRLSRGWSFEKCVSYEHH